MKINYNRTGKAVMSEDKNDEWVSSIFTFLNKKKTSETYVTVMYTSSTPYEYM